MKVGVLVYPLMAKDTPFALVTGAAGFLGFHLCKKLHENGFKTIGIDDISTGLASNAEDLAQYETTFIKADVSESWDSWSDKLPEKFDYVFHFASPASPPLYQQMPLKTLAVNSLGLYRALEFATSKGARLVFASTSEVYGSPDVSPQSESYWGNVNSFGPRSCYDEAKRFGEALIYSYNQERKTKHGLVRIFNTYGPRMNPNDGRVIINFLMQLKNNQPLTVQGEGTQTRSFCYVDDLIDGIWAYAQNEILTQPINLGNDIEFTIFELAQKIQSLSKTPPSIAYIERAEDDPPQRKPDLSLAKTLLGWSPKIPLEEGLKKVLAALK
ncbi:MAG: NAD-dependent epimerase/dehydratase family protein [Bdellovibrionota bacterium]